MPKKGRAPGNAIGNIRRASVKGAPRPRKPKGKG